MFLKKINTDLLEGLKEAGLTEPTIVQKKTFGTIKSGADCVISAPDGMGKSTAIVINAIQRLEKAFEQSPRALVIVQDKAKVLEMEGLFKQYAKYTDLRVYGVYEQGDIDYDKNQISVGIDVLIGTPGTLSDMFSSAGFDVNRLKMFILDDANVILKVRHDTKVMRMSDGIVKTQRIFFTDDITERVESLADRIMIEPLFFEFEEEDNKEAQEEQE
ncbi:RNA helicase [Flavobacterium arcticum]|uniref:RNA helicase n=1 Tax=Flavobacterium arcticum TaxID=1784713 RepID=A0A345H858_9FLAO|nr:DEAD/DEAH box helicase [Flavobacterium arcticum]AXG72768.1 RNA helicase [Flavobacterium arcticum]KAF2510962.1 DEAD/DEAH box helicase [Flavobacterium arcticum]